MVLSNAEKKRRSRATKSTKYHDLERETSRRRMATYRARNRALKRAKQLKSILGEEDRKEIEAHAITHKRLLLCEWFRLHKLRFDPKVINDTKILDAFMTKADIHKVEMQVAEFEISIIEDNDDDGDYYSNHFNGLALEVDGGKCANQCVVVEKTDIFVRSITQDWEEGKDVTSILGQSQEVKVVNSMPNTYGNQSIRIDPSSVGVSSDPRVFSDSQDVRVMLGQSPAVQKINCMPNIHADQSTTIDKGDAVVPSDPRIFGDVDYEIGVLEQSPAVTKMNDESHVLESPLLAEVKEQPVILGMQWNKGTIPGVSGMPIMQGSDTGAEKVLPADENHALLDFGTYPQVFGDVDDITVILEQSSAVTDIDDVSGMTVMQGSDSRVEKCLVGDENEALLDFDMDEFSLENNIGIDADLFGADAYTW
mmetsp:Transcript_17631/g.31887  ORF Transcript_17631/g.31887 Transcript_17631/m.31887 type:complete len:423 (-) Transcript_17631:454-1722(-)|eukprot:CAMPEP_0201632754 /NCGR_PEP_ID=MMETSP0493-20130528/6284_1 /ASSEMBLY_ACC=CAM_ASM_000838 /TAXON_ID=420259 /ORGANISM="Thalassiosira gravida, Strain GMp14c1" /LENGTH=422 /DNA_ID=CAMNT_0048104333 /DNA_START=249 /DNA_END=1517 /DNA_ORIENTATION=+